MLAGIMGVTTAIVLAVFAGIFWPHVVKNRQQFYFAIGAVLLIIVFETLDGVIQNAGFRRFASLMIGVGQIVGILGIILSTSGQSMGEFAADTVEVVRRGEEEREILVKGAGTRRSHERDAADAAGRIDLGSTDAVAGGPPLRANVPPPPPPPGGPIP